MILKFEIIFKIETLFILLSLKKPLTIGYAITDIPACFSMKNINETISIISLWWRGHTLY